MTRRPIHSSLQEQHESKLLIKCLMECYRAHPGQVAMLLDMTTAFLYSTGVDFTFLKASASGGGWGRVGGKCWGYFEALGGNSGGSSFALKF